MMIHSVKPLLTGSFSGLWTQCRMVAVLAVFGTILNGVHAGAEESAPRLSLQSAIQTALTQNPAIEAATATKAASDERIPQAKSGLYPQVDFNQGFNRTTNPMWAFGTKMNQEAIAAADFDPHVLNDPDPINNFSSRLSVVWPVFDSGQTWIGMQQAKLDSQANGRMLESVQQQVIARTVRAYLDLLLASAQLSVVDKALETARAHLKIVQDRQEGGLSVKSDLLRDVVHVADLEQQRLQAKNMEEIGQSILNAAMGVPEKDRYQLDTQLTKRSALEESLDFWIHTALSKRPDYLQMMDQVEIARKQVEKERAAHLPSLSLMGNYEVNTEDFNDTGDNYTVGAMVNLNLFSGNRISAKIREATANLKSAEARLSGLTQQVRVETQQAYLQSLSAWQRIDASEAAVNQADENLRIVKTRYENGLLTIVSLLDAEAASQKAQTNYLQAIHDHQAARTQLALATGTLDESFF
jgi:outer membrane protein